MKINIRRRFLIHTGIIILAENICKIDQSEILLCMEFQTTNIWRFSRLANQTVSQRYRLSEREAESKTTRLERRDLAIEARRVSDEEGIYIFYGCVEEEDLHHNVTHCYCRCYVCNRVRSKCFLKLSLMSLRTV